MRFIVDPRSNILYGSFYIYALRRMYGRRSVCYRAAPFAKLPEIGFSLRLIVRDGQKDTKVFIYTDDSYILNEEMYEWCDVYASTNANFTHYPKEKYPKLVSLAPSFGIRCYPILETIWYAFSNLLKSWHFVMKRSVYNKYSEKYETNRFKNAKRFVYDYFKCYFRRPSYCDYEKGESCHDYIFFLSTLWYNNQYNKNDEGVNYRRALFVRACKKNKSAQFEGGLLGDDTSSNDLFRDVLAEHKIPMKEWIERTKISSIVFNTPAFWNCHGWKLGEYLAMGKCIISTQLSNDLPAPMVHGENIHIVNDSENSMTSAIMYILSHKEYKHKLERGASEYWATYGSPEASINLLLSYI